MKIFCGNLSFTTTEAELRQHFQLVGAVSMVHIPVHQDTGAAKGFAFVSMADVDAREAIRFLNGQELGGRALTLAPSRERESMTNGRRSK